MKRYRKSYSGKNFHIFDIPQYFTRCELKDGVRKRNLLDPLSMRSQIVDPSVGGCDNIWPFDRSGYDLANAQSNHS